MNARQAHALLAQRRPERFTPDELCHPKQAALVSDESRNVIACCGRRSGKTVGACIRMLLVARRTERCNVLYVGATRDSAKRNAWKPLLELNRGHGLGGSANYSELSLTLPNASTQYMLGVDTEQMAEKIRGIPRLALAIVDECQRYPDEMLNTLTRDVIRPALRDMRGAIWLMGTPNPSGKLGRFWELWNNKRWSRHGCTIYDNTKLGTAEETEAIISEDLEVEGLTKESAWFRREYLAEWVVDLASRVYHFDEARNVYETLPRDLDHWLLGVDLGTADADAIAPLGWRDDASEIYLAHEDVVTGQTVQRLAEKLGAIWAFLNPIKIVVDTGGGGLKTLVSVQHLLPDVPLMAATKPPVNLQVKMLNNVLKTGRLKVPRGSRFADDCRGARWVEGIVGGKVDETGAKHSDLVPAVRYAVIAAAPFWGTDDERTPEQRERERQEAEEQARLLKAQKQWGCLRRDEDDYPAEDAEFWE